MSTTPTWGELRYWPSEQLLERIKNRPGTYRGRQEKWLVEGVLTERLERQVRGHEEDIASSWELRNWLDKERKNNEEETKQMIEETKQMSEETQETVEKLYNLEAENRSLIAIIAGAVGTFCAATLMACCV
jgi:hypothetical protein